MADPARFDIESGILAFALVDKAAPGYLDTWLAPAGKNAGTVALADYNVSSQSWSCQVTSGQLTPSGDTTTQDIAPTFCAAGKTVPTPKETSFALDVEYFQDPQVKLGLSRFLHENDTQEAYYALGLNVMDPPGPAIGRVRVQAGAFGGPARTSLTGTISLPCTGKPQIEWGITGDSAVVPSATATGATAGIPGTWTPAGSTPPANAAGATAAAIVASPATVWTVGQYMQGSTAGVPGEMHWSGTAWATGRKT